MSAAHVWYMPGPGVGEDYIATFAISGLVVNLSAPTALVGSVTMAFDTLIGGVWTRHGVIISGSAINSATIVAGGSVGSGSVDGIRPNIGGSWTGHLKVYITAP